MAASYPTSAASFPSRNNGDTVVPIDHNAPCDEIAAIESALLTGLAHWVKAQGVNIGAVDAQTIASGVITVTKGSVVVDTQGASAADDLDTITAGTPTNGPALSDGALLVLSAASAARVVTAKDATGNLLLAGDFTFTTTDARLLLLYNGTNWVEIARSNSGAWVTPTFAAGNFTASSGNWTVDSGDVTTFAYRLVGNTMTFAFIVNATDVSATPTTLRITIPAGKTATKSIQTICYGRDAGGALEAVIVYVSAAGTTINFDKLSGSAWTATSSDNTGVFGQITFEVN